MTEGSSSIANVTVRSKPCGPVMSTRKPCLNGSAAIQTSGQLLCENDFLFPERRGFPPEYAFSFAGILMKARISMNVLRFRQAAAMVTALFLIPASFAQGTGGEKVDLDALAQIKTEAFQHS